jgi:hypothetical protein
MQSNDKGHKMASSPLALGYVLRKRFSNYCIATLSFALWLCCAPLNTVIAQEVFSIGTGVSGSWYSPSRSGEGFFIEDLGNDEVLIYWFTYSGDNASQAWLVGTGTLTGNELHVPELSKTSGPVFGEDYNPDDLNLETWGELTIGFDSCNSAELSYRGLDGNANWSIDRLAGVLGTKCSADANQYSHYSGSWFKASRNGEGWILQQFTKQDFLAAWFTYNTEGEQAWMTGVGHFDNEQLEFKNLEITHGTRFGDGFDPNEVVRESWGDIYFSFEDCDSGSVDYESHIPPHGKTRRTFDRLTNISGVDCYETKPLTIDRGSWVQQEMPFDRLGARAASIDGMIYLSGGFNQARRLDRYDPQTSQWQRLADLPDSGRTRHAMVAHKDMLYVFGGIRGGNWTTVGQTSVLRYSTTEGLWEVMPSLPGSLHTGAAVSVGNSIYILSGHRAGFWRFDPTGQTYTSLPNAGIRIGARLILFKGEIWLIGGYDNVADLNQVKIFNPIDETWRDGPSLGDLRAGFAAQLLHGQIITVGGEVTINTAARLNRQVEVLGSEETGWIPGRNPGFSVYDAASAVVDGRFYLFGGGNLANTLNSTRHLQIFTPVTD